MKSLQCLVRILDAPEDSGELLFMVHRKTRKGLVMKDRICVSRGWLWSSVEDWLGRGCGNQSWVGLLQYWQHLKYFPKWVLSIHAYQHENNYICTYILAWKKKEQR